LSFRAKSRNLSINYYFDQAMKAGFLEKLIERLGRIGPEEVQNYFLRLAQEKGFLETVFNAIHEGIIVTDSNGRVTYLNDAACKLFGLEAADAIGKRLDERVRGLDWESLTQSGGPVSRDMEIFYPDNRFINFYIVPLLIEHREAAGPTRDGGGARPANPAIAGRVGHVMILRDITESRRTAQQTIESERLNALTLLAAGVAHEIGNPLNSLHIHLQLMERKAQELNHNAKSELQESIDVARSEVRRLDSIVTQFLRAIRPSQPRLHPENVNTIVEEAVRFFTPEIQDRDIVVKQELRANLPLLQLDREQMKQVFYNIIKNSLEAMRRHGTLRIRTDLDDTHVMVSFVDTGGGMSAENLSRVFEPYFTTKPSGTGLGLLIVRRIVREHGGELSIESSQDKGLTLTIRLPYVEKRIRMLEAGENKRPTTRANPNGGRSSATPDELVQGSQSSPLH
jgi:two-component system, sporulation sensor kinase E